MLEQKEPERTGSALSLLGGLFLGAVAGVLIPVVVFGLVASLVSAIGVRVAVVEVLDLAILAGIGYRASQEFGQSMFASGLTIGISLAFLLNVICGLVALHG